MMPKFGIEYRTSKLSTESDINKNNPNIIHKLLKLQF